MKRYLIPLLILVVLLSAGSSLWLRSDPVPPADTASPAESAEAEAETPGESEAVSSQGTLSDADLSSAEPAPAETASADSAPAGELPAAPADSAPAGSQPDSVPQAETASPQTQPPPVAEEPLPDDQPAIPAADLSSMAQDLLTEMNRERAASGAAPLTLDPALSSVAVLRAEEGTTHFSHTRPDGSSYRSAVDNAGLSYRHLGENLATGHTSAQAVIHDWNNSAGHHDNIVSENFTKVGIGLAKNNGNPHEGYTWAVVFSD